MAEPSRVQRLSSVNLVSRRGLKEALEIRGNELKPHPPKLNIDRRAERQFCAWPGFKPVPGAAVSYLDAL